MYSVCSYPLIPPHVQFITKVLHPNVSRHGNIGLDSIHHNWSLALTLSKILLSIQSLLTDPYLKICMEPAIAKYVLVVYIVMTGLCRLCQILMTVCIYILLSRSVTKGC